jgi:hypothetical protein
MANLLRRTNKLHGPLGLAEAEGVTEFFTASAALRPFSGAMYG